jgi:hypothetical protein
MIGIDPGSKESAICELLVSSGNKAVFQTMKIPNEELLIILPKYQDQVMAIEIMQSMGMTVGAEVFVTCEFIGKFSLVHGDPIIRLTRTDMKMHLCGNVRAKDANIRAALIERFGNPGVKKAPGRTYGISKDQWSALAIAVTAIELTHKIRLT